MFRGLVCYESEDEMQDDKATKCTDLSDDSTEENGKECGCELKKETAKHNECFDKKKSRNDLGLQDQRKKRLDSFKERLQKLKDKHPSVNSSSGSIASRHDVAIKIERPRDYCSMKKKISLSYSPTYTKSAKNYELGKLGETSKSKQSEKKSKNADPISKIVKDVYTKQKARKCDFDVIPQLQCQDFQICEQYDPHGAKRSKIEKELDEAIKQNDLELAEKISDEISERNMAKNISQSFKANDFLEQKKFAKEKQDRKRKKLKWMFDHKERWELKGNM
eukprot:gene2717-930_t